MSRRAQAGQRTSHSQTISNEGSWSLEQNLAYTIFIDINKKSMTSKKKMRQMSFYDKLSLFVATRTSSQCRSHHQKLFAKYKHLTKIRQLFRNEIGVSEYKRKLAQGFEIMEKIDQQHQNRPLEPLVEMESQDPSVQADSGAKQYPFISYPIHCYPTFPPFHPMCLAYGEERQEIQRNPYWDGYHAAMQWMMGMNHPQ